MDIGSLIKKRRKELGFSQRQLSYMSNISNTEISRIEGRVTKQPSQEILKKLAGPLKLNYEDLLKAAGYYIGKGEMGFGDKLKSLREKRNISVDDLSRTAGLSVNNIKSIESGEQRNLPQKVIDKLAKALRVQPEYFLIDDARLPMDILDLPPDIIEMILSADSMPFLQLTKKAMDQGITPEQLNSIINIFIAGSKKINHQV